MRLPLAEFCFNMETDFCSNHTLENRKYIKNEKKKLTPVYR